MAISSATVALSPTKLVAVVCAAQVLVQIGAFFWPALLGKLQTRLSIPPSTLSHHLKTLIIVGLVTQQRDATTLICRANYLVMRGLLDFLVAECCTEADCASIRQQN